MRPDRMCLAQLLCVDEQALDAFPLKLFDPLALSALGFDLRLSGRFDCCGPCLMSQ